MKLIEAENYNIGGARSLYVHVPFCEAKCPYCAFASAAMRPGDAERYAESAALEIARRTNGIHELDTLYVGGGTPSVLPLGAWEKILSAMENNFSFAPGAEMTVEANPGSLNADHVKLWREWGFNRISIGVQSLEDARLKFLGRVHDARQARSAVAMCLEAGFSVSLDMMFGLPGETPREWMADLREVARLGAHHISVYQLSIESGTPFAGENFALPEGYAQYRYAQWRLARAGYAQYEVASFAMAGRESRHNLNYWADGEYAGIGPSAWSYIGGSRYKNAASLGEYCARAASGSPVVMRERIEGEAAARQAAVLALRASRGIEWEKFSARHGKSAAEKISRELKNFPEDLVQSGEKSTRLTPKGFRVGNAIWREIV